MASQDTTILLSGGTRLSQRLISDLQQLQQIRTDLTQIKAIMDAAAVGATVPADYSAIEGRFNIQSGATAGANGQTTYNLIVNALTRLNAAPIDAILAQLVS